MGINNKVKKISLFEGIALLVSGMVGSAIFSLSGLTIVYAGPSSIVSWIIAAVIQLCYGFAMTELALTYKKNGGVFVFPQKTFEGEKGNFLGFMSLWGTIIADIISIAFSAMYIGIYLSVSFAGIDKYSRLLSIIVIIVCLFLNYIKFSTTGKISIILAISLTTILLLYSIVSINFENFSINNYSPFFSQGSIKYVGFLRSIPIAVIGYAAVAAISFMADDIENPKKNIPHIVIVSVIIVALIYTIVLFATLGNVTATELNDTGMAYIPLFAVCFNNAKNSSVITVFISIAAVIALFTTILVVIAMDGRNIKAAADNGLFPKTFSKEGKNGTPIYAMSTIAIISVILSQFTSIIEILINLGAIFIIATIIINMISLICTRKKHKSSDKYFVAPISNKFIVVVLIILLFCYVPDIISGGTQIWLFTVCCYLVGFIVYKFKHNFCKKECDY